MRRKLVPAPLDLRIMLWSLPPSRYRIMRKYHLPHVLVSSIAIMLILVMGGCYSHVIRVEGMGSDRYDTYEPNYKLESDKDKSTSTKMLPSKVARPR